jgi:phosphoinositide-3-kinase regulatory subunit 4
MGNTPSLPVVSMTDNIEDAFLSHAVLKRFKILETLQSSGRMMKTFKLEPSCIAKAMWTSSSQHVEEQRQELIRIKKALAGNPHMATFTWFMGAEVNNRRPIVLLRPYFYTTLSDRLASRPWLDPVEKLWFTLQFLQALDSMHTANVVHGNLCTENIALTASGWLVLTDIASYKAITALPDDDPSAYLYYFQRKEHKRCYIAPERFFGRDEVAATGLTAPMDIFSAGCVLVELFLNGERCLDLGDLMEYRRHNSNSLQQKLNKIENAAIRAACRHMLTLEPSKRLTARAYLERLRVQDQIPDSFETLTSLVERTVQVITPDARIAICASQYKKILSETMGEHAGEDQLYLEQVLGPVMMDMEGGETDLVDDEGVSLRLQSPTTVLPTSLATTDLFAETAALLAELDSLNIDDNFIAKKQTAGVSLHKETMPEADTNGKVNIDRSSLSKSSLLIYLQLLLATVRHVQRPTTKLVALQIINRVGLRCSDETRLQRIVPVLVSLLQDQDPLVRVSAIQCLGATVAVIERFSPSDSKVFPQYIFKRVGHLISDPSLIVRIAFAQSIATFAETALRFLDISHAVRLYEAVGTGTNTGGATPAEDGPQHQDILFADDVARLLDTESSRLNRTGNAESSIGSGRSENTLVAAGKTLISSTFNSELANIYETVSRWVVHITTDQAQDAAQPKRALLSDLGRLCIFFGLEGVMSFILPQILAFLNDRKNWELRADLFESLPSVCHIVGRAATEEFVLPCVEIGLVDNQEIVIHRSLTCLSRLIDMKLLSRSVLLGLSSTVSIAKRYRALVVHPSQNIRREAITTFSIICNSVNSPDCEVYLIPLLRPFLRFLPPVERLFTSEGFASCVQPAWTRERFSDNLSRCSIRGQNLAKENEAAWTSIGIQVQENADATGNILASSRLEPEVDDQDPQLEPMKTYLLMHCRHTVKPASQDWNINGQLKGGIEGSTKLAQSVMFPRQNGNAVLETLPSWYSVLRDTIDASEEYTAESTAIRSVSTLGHVYGLSIMGPAEAYKSNLVGAADDPQGTKDKTESDLKTSESRLLQAACIGQWGSETMVEPDLIDTTLLVTKLKALKVPPLPPNLGNQLTSALNQTPHMRGTVKDSTSDWKPRVNALIASSSLHNDHAAPVVRLAVSPDGCFFVSGSHDGTCRVWETQQIEDSAGSLESNLVYTNHSDVAPARVNDLALIEGSHSIVSGDSRGFCHVWRVDMISQPKKTALVQTGSDRGYDKSKVVGSTNVRTICKDEGEILCVSHFNTHSSSIITFASQKGIVHSWDLRCAREPFTLQHGPELGHLTNSVLGNDRFWLAAGTNRGYISLWDIRFQKAVKLWRHNRKTPITRLATSFGPPPQVWGGQMNAADAKPFVFVASGSNECGMFDALSGQCRESFRTVIGDSRELNAYIEEPPTLESIRIASFSSVLAPKIWTSTSELANPSSIVASSINAMVGSIGGLPNQSFLITGGSDNKIRFWDFATPTKCYIVAGYQQNQFRPSFERFDFSSEQRVMICRQPHYQNRQATRMPLKQYSGLHKPDTFHTDAIHDLKILDNKFLLSCSRDATIKVWR